MADYDFEPPSFSLGFDFDLDSQPDITPPQQSVPQPAKRPSTAPSLRPIVEDDDDDFEFLVRVSEPPLPLKRLRRVTTAAPPPPPPPPPEEAKVNIGNRWGHGDDDIEDFSSDEDCLRGSLRTNSVCSSSKPSLHRKNVVTSDSGTQCISRKCKEVPSASASINVETRGSNVTFPKLTLSPLRRFQLIDSDSDSDDLSVIEDKHNKVPNVILSPEDKKLDYCREATLGNQESKTSVRRHQTEDLWKDKIPSIPTPAFDEYCTEYFTASKNNNKHTGSGVNMDKASLREESLPASKNKRMPKTDSKQHTGGGMNTDKASIPHAYHYYFHKDSRIMKLVRERLPHYFPLDVGDDQEDEQQNFSATDNKVQYGSGQFFGQTKRMQNAEKNIKRSRKNTKASQVDGVSEHSGDWVTPKSCAGVRNSAGSRKVQVASGSTGHWYMGQGGRRVYVTKNGQELTGQIAYRHYKKESGGMGPRNSKKKPAAAKKKTAPKKK